MKINSIYAYSILLIGNLIFSNSQNSFGTVGINLTPTARFHDEGTFSYGLSRHDDFSRIDFLAQPYEWLEVSFFYADIPSLSFPASLGSQSYKDKGFNLKILAHKETDLMPQIALGLSDFAGTGLFSSEYIIASKKVNKFDLSLGIGWGLFDSGLKISNPMHVFGNNFEKRNYDFDSTIGEFDGDDLFSGESASFFGSITYEVDKNTKLLIETNPVDFTGRLESAKNNSKYFLGIEKKLWNDISASIFFGQKDSVNINLSAALNISKIKREQYTPPKERRDIKIYDLALSLQNNNIFLKDIYIDEKERLVIGIRQNYYNDISKSEKNVLQSINFSGIDNYEEVIIKNYYFGEEVNQNAYNYKEEKELKYYDPSPNRLKIYAANEKFPITKFSINPSLRTLVASRESFLKYGLLLKGNIDHYFNEKVYIKSELAVSLADDFDNLYIPPVTTYPAQVRSDVKEYLKNIGNGLLIQRFEVNYLEKINNHFFNIKAGILEEMFQGYGFEYLNLYEKNNTAIGFELFHVKKRGYEYNFDTLDYETVTGHINFYHHLHKLDLTTHISWGQYLAGDEGITFDFSKRFSNGAKFGAFFSLTDVSFDEFGEGSFDKGVYIQIPISSFGNRDTSYRWRPLTKDPAQKLNLSSRLFSVLERYVY